MNLQSQRHRSHRYLTWLCQRLALAKPVDDHDALLPWKMPVDPLP
jgi:hypothetical protein